MNVRDWAKIQFGTLTDYFDAVRESPKPLSTLTGDFFTYADHDDHYWAGYFTSRPFYKRMDRVLMHHLRAAEVLVVHALSTAASAISAGLKAAIDAQLTFARREMGLFQHHDGVTGTAKDQVVKDYAERMRRAISAAQDIIATCYR